MLENSERSVRGVRMGKSGPLARAELANQIQGFRIPDRWDASEKNKCMLFAGWEVRKVKLDCDQGIISSPRSQRFILRTESKLANNLCTFILL